MTILPVVVTNTFYGPQHAHMKGMNRMNALVKSNNTALAKGSNPFESSGSSMSSGGGLYMKFNGNTGELTYGAEGVEIPEGTLLIVNPNECRRGWICWKDEQVAEELMYRILDRDPPEEHDLPDHGPYTVHEDGTKDGWSAQVAIPFLLREDDGTIVELTYKTSSKSAIRAVGNLLKAYGRLYKSHDGELPVVEFGTESWMPKVKKHGKKFSPKFTIVDWASEAALAAESEGSEEDYEDDRPDPAPKTETKALAPKEEPEAKEPVKPPVTEPADETDKPKASEAKGPRRRSF